MTVKYAEKTPLGFSEESSVLLCRLIKKMARNPFYKERFNSLGIVLKRLKGLKTCPSSRLYQEDLRKLTLWDFRLLPTGMW